MTAFEGLVTFSIASQPLILFLAKLYLTKISKTVQTIHVAVNSERTRMMLEIEALKDEIRKLQKS